MVVEGGFRRAPRGWPGAVSLPGSENWGLGRSLPRQVHLFSHHRTRRHPRRLHRKTLATATPRHRLTLDHHRPLWMDTSSPYPTRIQLTDLVVLGAG